MPLNAQAEIARVLAIEPEGSQADAIRQFVRDELGAELMLVSSAYAAVVASKPGGTPIVTRAEVERLL